MKKAKKALALVLCAVLLVAGSVMGTLAYLTSTTETVNNTFTVGNVSITLDETQVDAYGNILYGPSSSTNKVTSNEYKLIPGHEYTKDPTVHVTAGSEDAWLFVKVENDIVDIEAPTTIADQMAANGWKLVADQTNVYAYKETVSAGDNIPVFGAFTIKGTADVASYGTASSDASSDSNSTASSGPSIKVTAYAVQADSFTTAADAWAAAPANWS